MKKPKSNRRNYIVKPKVSKKLIISTVASVMAVTIALSLVWHAMRVSVPVEANTLSGVSEALKDHGSGEAYIILDIVPGTTDDDLPLGTIGYLSSGQSQLEKKLAEIFRSDLERYKNYNIRKDKAGTLAESGADSEYKYLESPYSGNGTWTEIYGGDPFNINADDFVEYEQRGNWSFVKGHVTPADGGDYILVNAIPEQLMMQALDDSSYERSNERLYEGYSLLSSDSLTDENISQYDSDTPVYIVDDDGRKYTYVSTIAGFPAIKEEKDKELEELEKTITENVEEIKSYKENITELQTQYDDLIQQLEDLKQKETTTPKSDVTEGDGTGTENASLNWVKFVGVDPLSDEQVIEEIKEENPSEEPEENPTEEPAENQAEGPVEEPP